MAKKTFQFDDKDKEVEKDAEIAVIGSIIATIPSEYFRSALLTSVDFSKAKNLKSIYESAFNSCNSLKKVVCPKSLESIDKNAFFGCTMLALLVLNEGLLRIGNGAFYECYSIEYLCLPSTLECIWPEAFASCTGLVKAALNEDLSKIMGGAFKNCPKLVEMGVSLLNTHVTPGSIAKRVEISTPQEVFDKVFPLMEEKAKELGVKLPSHAPKRKHAPQSISTGNRLLSRFVENLAAPNTFATAATPEEEENELEATIRRIRCVFEQNNQHKAEEEDLKVELEEKNRQVSKLEEELEETKENLEDRQQQLEDAKQRLEEAEEECEELTEERDGLRERVEEKKRQVSKLSKDKKKLLMDHQQVEEELEETKENLDESQRNLEAAKQCLEETKKECEELREERDGLRERVEERQQCLEEAELRANEANMECEEMRAERNGLILRVEEESNSAKYNKKCRRSVSAQLYKATKDCEVLRKEVREVTTKNTLVEKKAERDRQQWFHESRKARDEHMKAIVELEETKKSWEETKGTLVVVKTRLDNVSTERDNLRQTNEEMTRNLEQAQAKLEQLETERDELLQSKLVVEDSNTTTCESSSNQECASEAAPAGLSQGFSFLKRKAGVLRSTNNTTPETQARKSTKTDKSIVREL